MKYLAAVYIGAKLALVLALAIFVGSLVGLVQQAGDTLVQTRQSMVALTGEISQLRHDVTGELHGVHTDAVKELKLTRAAAVDQLGGFKAMASAHLAIVEAAGITNAAQLNSTLAGFRTDLQPTLRTLPPFVTDAQATVDDLFFDLKAGVASATVAANQIGQMSMEARQSFPHALKTWDAIGKNVDGITGNINSITKPRWYDRLIGYGLNGIIIYRNLNPAAPVQIGVKAAQAIGK